MNPVDGHLIVRAVSLYISVVLTAVVWVLRRPGRRELSGAMLALVWNLPLLLALHLVADRAGWWRFDAAGGLLLGMPVDLYLAWACLWGTVPALAMPRLRLGVVMLVALAVDLVLMPAASPVVQLGHGWLAGEFAGLFFCLLPGQLLARWTARDEHLVLRTVLQVIAFTGLLLFVLPAVVIEGSGGGWTNPLVLPGWEVSLIVQVLALPAMFGLSAVQEFVMRGGGTPFPFDAPRKIVTSGVYAYVGNPMQLSAVVLLLILGIILGNLWLSAAGVMAHVYSIGIAGWDEGEDLRRRFGKDWIVYHQHVPRWIPRWRPWYRAGDPMALLYVSENCGMCSEVGRWFQIRNASGLSVVAAESHSCRSLTRIRYEPGDGSRAETGVGAIARSLEHIHLGWAAIGFLLRMPLVSTLAQLLVDASGGEPRQIPLARK